MSGHGASPVADPAGGPPAVPLRSRLLKDAATLGLGQTVALGAGALATLLAARWLGATAKGQLTLMFAVPALLGPLAAAGVDSYIAARAGGRGPEPRRAVIRLAVAASRWGGAALAFATLAYGIGTELPTGPVLFAAALAGLRPGLAVAQAVATSDDQVARVGRALVAMAVTHLSLVVVLAVDGASVGDFAAASAVSVLVGRRLLRPPVSRRGAGTVATLAPAQRREVLRFGGAVVVGDALQLASYRMDLFVLAAFVPVADVGVYAVAVALAEILWQLPQVVSRSILPRIVAGQLDRSGVLRISKAVGVATAGLALVGWLLAVHLVEPVFGADFVRVPLVLAVLLPGAVVVSAAKPIAAWTLSCGCPSRNVKASAAGFAVVAAGNVLLVPSFGILGAAVASTLGYGVVAAGVALLAPTSHPSASLVPEDKP
ncbi:MAG: polysaccharide biosynthesis C-terminal domain-containing protein [Actinomycetota bacterium]|nr:polysaccharide biosynthesis C-terminal domain-containing protein [Actinomycetota bacterium]